MANVVNRLGRGFPTDLSMVACCRLSGPRNKSRGFPTDLSMVASTELAKGIILGRGFPTDLSMVAYGVT